jgi:phosphonate transport system substrate-binding protein
MESLVNSKQIRKVLKLPLALLAVSGALLIGPVSHAEVEDDKSLTLSLGLYTSNKPSTMVRKFRPIVKHLEENMTSKLGKEVNIRMQLAKNYQQGIEHLTAGKVDFSRFGPASYVEAKRSNPELEILAVESSQNRKVFYGIIATHVDNTMQSVTELEGKSFAFGDQQSTIGRFLSQQYLADNGIGAKSLSNFEYLGRHDTVGSRVGAGDFAAGALNESTFRKLLSKGEPIRELARFPNVTKPWIARSGLDPEVFQALKQCLLEITDQQSLTPLKIDGFLEGADEDFEVIRTAIEDNERFFNLHHENIETAEAVAPAKETSVQEVEVADIESVE